MTLQEFELKIQQEIDGELEARQNTNIPDMAGVYYQGTYIGIGIPSQGIFEDFRPGYRNDMGYPHKTSTKAIEEIKAKLPKYKKMLQEDPDLFNPASFSKYTK